MSSKSPSEHQLYSLGRRSHCILHAFSRDTASRASPTNSCIFQYLQQKQRVSEIFHYTEGYNQKNSVYKLHIHQTHLIQTRKIRRKQVKSLQQSSWLEQSKKEGQTEVLYTIAVVQRKKVCMNQYLYVEGVEDHSSTICVDLPAQIHLQIKTR